jgi:hypothetical protein
MESRMPPARQNERKLTQSGHIITTSGSSPQPRTSTTNGNGDAHPKPWYDGVRQNKNDPRLIAAGLHRLADVIYHPDMEAGAARSTAAKKGVAESRNGTRTPANTKKAASNKKTAGRK